MLLIQLILFKTSMWDNNNDNNVGFSNFIDTIILPKWLIDE